MKGDVGVGPDVMEQCEDIHVETCFNWKFSKEEKVSSFGGGVAQFEKDSENFVLKDG